MGVISRRARAAIALLVIVCFCSGCGTFVTRTGVSGLSFGGADSEFHPVYPATVDVDFWLLSAPFRSDGGSAGERAGYLIFGLCDTPISLVTDTLFLPYDIYKMSSNRPNQGAANSRQALRFTMLDNLNIYIASDAPLPAVAELNR